MFAVSVVSDPSDDSRCILLLACCKMAFTYLHLDTSTVKKCCQHEAGSAQITLKALLLPAIKPPDHARVITKFNQNVTFHT